MNENTQNATFYKLISKNDPLVQYRQAIGGFYVNNDGTATFKSDSFPEPVLLNRNGTDETGNAIFENGDFKVASGEKASATQGVESDVDIVADDEAGDEADESAQQADESTEQA